MANFTAQKVTMLKGLAVWGTTLTFIPIFASQYKAPYYHGLDREEIGFEYIIACHRLL